MPDNSSSSLLPVTLSSWPAKAQSFAEGSQSQEGLFDWAEHVVSSRSGHLPGPQTETADCVLCVLNHRSLDWKNCLLNNNDMGEIDRQNLRTPLPYFPFEQATLQTASRASMLSQFTHSDRQVFPPFQCQRRFSSTSSYGGLDTLLLLRASTVLYCVRSKRYQVLAESTRHTEQGSDTPVGHFLSLFFFFHPSSLPSLPAPRCRQYARMVAHTATLAKRRKKHGHGSGAVLALLLLLLSRVATSTGALPHLLLTGTSPEEETKGGVSITRSTLSRRLVNVPEYLAFFPTTYFHLHPPRNKPRRATTYGVWFFNSAVAFVLPSPP